MLQPSEMGTPRDEQHPLLSGDDKVSITTNSNNAQERAQNNIEIPWGQRPFFGYVLAFLAGFSQAVRNFLFHYSEIVYGLPPASVFIVGATMFTLCSLSMLAQQRMLRALYLPRAQAKLVALSGFLGGIVMYLKDFSLNRIPLGLFMSLFASVPAITSVLSTIFLGDAMSLMDGAVLLLNVVGAVLVCQPTGSGDNLEALVGIIAVLGAATMASISYLLVKVVGVHAHYYVKTLSFGLGGLLFAPFVVGLDDIRILFQQQQGAMLAVLGGFCGFITKALISRALLSCRPGPALVVQSMNVPTAFILGSVFMGERFSSVTLVGVACVLMSISYIGLGTIIREKTGQLREASAGN